MFVRMLAVLLAAFALPASSFAWGPTGHRVAGAIADGYLTPSARGGLKQILEVESMAEASTWPDFQRSDPVAFWQAEASPFHYVTVPVGQAYPGAPPQGDAVTALQRFSATVRSPDASLADKQLALRFIIHIVGDLHQPLHSGKPGDRGGNDVRVKFFGERTNLHAIWDSGMIDREQLSFSEKAAWLHARITPEQLTQWDNPDPLIWIGESATLRDRIYPPRRTKELGYSYIWEHQAAVDQRLSQAGIRLAAYLNTLFAPGS